MNMTPSPEQTLQAIDNAISELMSLRHRAESMAESPTNPIVQASRVARIPAALSGTLPPPPPAAPELPPVFQSGVPEDWREILIRPPMATAMLYVLIPVIEAITTATTADEIASGINDLRSWARLTIAERVALTELFAWLDIEVSKPDSAVPDIVLANLAAAQTAYEAALAP